MSRSYLEVSALLDKSIARPKADMLKQRLFCLSAEGTSFLF
jgi:hypothetical protein